MVLSPAIDFLILFTILSLDIHFWIFNTVHTASWRGSKSQELEKAGKEEPSEVRITCHQWGKLWDGRDIDDDSSVTGRWLKSELPLG